MRLFSALATPEISAIVASLLRHKKLLVTAVISLMGSSIMMLYLPFAIRVVVENGFASADRAIIDAVFISLFVASVTLTLTTALRFYTTSLLAEKVVADIRTRLYKSLIYEDIHFHDRNGSGEIVSRLTVDADIARGFVAGILSSAVWNAILAFGAFCMLFVTSTELAAYTLMGVPLIVIPIILGNKKLQLSAKEVQERVADANSLAIERLTNIRAVKSDTQEAGECHNFDKSVGMTVAAAGNRILLQTAVTGSAIICIYGVVIVVIWLGALRVSVGSLSGGLLAQFMLYALIASGAVGQLAEVWGEFKRTAGGMSRVFQLLSESDSTAENYLNNSPEIIDGDIVFETVTFFYPNRLEVPALDRVSFSIKKGEMLAVVGASGAGKSTIFSLLLGFYGSYEGVIKIGGIDLSTLNPTSLRRSIGSVPQNPVIFSDTMRANIMYGAVDATEGNLNEAVKAARVTEFLGHMPDGMETQLGARGVSLSGGQNQRISISRALLKDAPILLMDEATSSLDLKNEKNVQSAVSRIRRDRTTIVIAHRLSTALKADRIIVMDGGKVVGCGSHIELFDQCQLYRDITRRHLQ